MTSEKDTPELGPQLVYEDSSVPCGYAPRTIHLSATGEALFVGCKDGSIKLIQPGKAHAGSASFESKELVEPGEALGAVRSICEWDEHRVLVARADGEVELLDWRSETPMEERRTNLNDALRESRDRQEDRALCVARLDKDHCLVSFRKGVPSGACWVFKKGKDGPHGKPQAVERPGSGSQLEPVREVRLVLPLSREVTKKATSPDVWLLVTEQGELLSWDGNASNPAKPLPGAWPDGERPSAINGFALLRNDSQREKSQPAQGVFLATDTGVYLVVLWPKDVNKQTGLTPELCRLSLSGLGAMCTAVSYTEDEPYHYLWVADANGDCHLFWADLPEGCLPRDKPTKLNFRRSGLVHADSQVLVCIAWKSTTSKALFFAQARRSDQVVLSRYWQLKDVSPKQDNHSAKDVRVLLAQGKRGDVLDFFQARHEQREGGESEDPSIFSDWPDEALLPELFERLAADPADRQILLESLLGSATWADEILTSPIGDHRRKHGHEGSYRVLPAEQVVELWTMTLLGIIHRFPGDRQTSYLGLLRWLRNRQQHLKKRHQEGFAELFDAIETSVRFARKWGVYGETNAWRENLVRPLRRLRQQSTKQANSRAPNGPNGEPLHPLGALDALTYEVLLFQRSVNVMDEEERGKMRGRTAWQISTAIVAGRRLAAVSWIWGGVELFGMERTKDGELRLVALEVLRPDAQKKGQKLEIQHEPVTPEGPWPPIRRLPFGSSRAIHLGKIGEEAFLLAAPILRRNSAGNTWEELRLRPVEPQGDEWFKRGEVRVRLSRPNESVYSFLEISEGWILAGLRGDLGTAAVALVKVWKKARRLRCKVVEWWDLDSTEPNTPSAGGRSDHKVHRNRAWSLAKADLDDGSNGTARCRVVVGCERGQVYRFTLRKWRESWVREPSETSGPVVERIVQMSSPVMALAYSESASQTRLFTGCEDGTLMAWQELSEDSRGSTSTAPGKRKFASLWATTERSAISSIHRLPDLSLRKSGSTVLAITQSGLAILLDDRTAVDNPLKGPSRTPAPGCRHGRLKLGTSAFACVEITEGAASETAEPRPEVALLVASGEGTLRLSGIHAPYYSEQRDEAYEAVIRGWWERVGRDNQLRLGGALYRTTPVLELILVRWLLDPTYSNRAPDRGKSSLSKKSRVPEDIGSREWLLPRHLRPLLDLRKAWKNLEEAWKDLEISKGDAATSKVTPEMEQEVDKAGVALERGLRRAWQLDDLRLFQEICEVVLKKANYLLFETLTRKSKKEEEDDVTLSEPSTKKKEAVRALYERIVNAVELTIRRWYGAPEHEEARARMVVAKHLVNGDTFWKVLSEAAAELSASDPKLGKPFFRILQRRFQGVSEEMFKRDSLVSLETLRAANLSLLRLCKRLSLVREKGTWRPRQDDRPEKAGEEAEVHWPVLKPYFDHLVGAAARTFRSRPELTDALAHEYSRTFALAIYACPSATLRITTRMTETQLISDPDSEDDLSHRVERQLRLLSKIGLQVPPNWVFRLFQAASRPPQNGVDPLERLRKDLPKGTDGNPKEKIGSTLLYGYQNHLDLECLETLYCIVGWFTTLTENLTNHAGQIDLTPTSLTELRERLEKLKTLENGHLYRHSFDFWNAAADNLEPALQGAGVSDKELVRPCNVLYSREISERARASRDDLVQRYKDSKIFQPEYRTFQEVLMRLERAAHNFPRSAAVHQNIVRGVLGHHLLEDLDEHVLELVEIAQVMDPLKVWSQQAGDPSTSTTFERDRQSTAERFTHYLLERSRNAQSIPKSLRALQGVLVEVDEKANVPVNDPQDALLGHLRFDINHENDPVRRWRVQTEQGKCPGFTEKELPFLKLILDELDQNDKIYGDGTESSPRKENKRGTKHTALTGGKWSTFGNPAKPNRQPIVSFPRPNPKSLKGRRPHPTIEVLFHFRKKLRKEAVQRLGELKANRLQEPIRPWPDRSIPSHGTGLYLANLAASVIEWQLSIADINQKECTVRFLLEKLAPEHKNTPPTTK